MYRLHHKDEEQLHGLLNDYGVASILRSIVRYAIEPLPDPENATDCEKDLNKEWLAFGNTLEEFIAEQEAAVHMIEL